ncbi:hypothetical protein BRC62_07980 [Halobacteriales archaeon QH_10_67_13]|nr:MAG: hypothetical protein BRC62_07980 [Halobacteriales archaeon QH_10_67_13]
MTPEQIGLPVDAHGIDHDDGLVGRHREFLECCERGAAGRADRNAAFGQPLGRIAGLPDVDAPAGPVYLAGEYTEWSAVQGAIASGRQAARAVGRRLDA